MKSKILHVLFRRIFADKIIPKNQAGVTGIRSQAIKIRPISSGLFPETFRPIIERHGLFVTRMAVPLDVHRVGELQNWLENDQAVALPEGWLEACLEWLAEEHGEATCSTFSQSQWQSAVFDQWLHTDLSQLSHPVLPQEVEHQQHQEVLLLEGELCLQVSLKLLSTHRLIQLLLLLNKIHHLHPIWLSLLG